MKFFKCTTGKYINPGKVIFYSLANSKEGAIVRFYFDYDISLELTFPSYDDACKELEDFAEFCEKI